MSNARAAESAAPPIDPMPRFRAPELAVIADFKGEVGDLYNRLRRALQRYCTDACSENGWEIPFPQLTLHGSLERP